MAKEKAAKAAKKEKVEPKTETPEDLVEEVVEETTLEEVEETTTEVVEDPNAWKEIARDEIANDFFDDDFANLTEGQQEKINAQVSKMRKPRKKSAPKEPKRTTGRMIAPTLRVKDEDAILKALYTLKAQRDDMSFKGGWGQATPDSNLGDLIEGLENLVSERKIADDTTEVVSED